MEITSGEEYELSGSSETSPTSMETGHKPRTRPGLTSEEVAADAFYFTERLREWYQRSDSISSCPVRATKTRATSWHSGALDTRGKNLIEIVNEARSDKTLPSPRNSVMDMKSCLDHIKKEDLVALIVQYYKELVSFGRTAEANRVLDLAAQLGTRSSGSDDLEDKKPLSGIDKLLKDGLLTFLLKLNKYLPPTNSQIIKFKNLSFTAQVQEAQEGFATVGSVVTSCLFPCFASKQAPAKFMVLQDCSGYLMPGTLTLVCGPPGCGKSSLHKALAGRLDKSPQFTGEVTYNGHHLGEFCPRRVAAYIAQTDRHLPTLTVRETVEFAYTCSSLFHQDAHKLTPESGLIGQELGGKDLPLEVTLHLLGLQNVANTVVGNAQVRGVSGGERHRVTTAEMVTGTYSVLFLDEISTGLDSSATYDIVSAVRTLSRLRQLTCLLSLLQPAPEVFELIDRLIVMNEGAIIYQGPREDAIGYFSELGYLKPKHVDVADFLQEITTADGLQYLQPGFSPLTGDDFLKAYMRSEMHKDVTRILDSPQVQL